MYLDGQFALLACQIFNDCLVVKPQPSCWQRESVEPITAVGYRYCKEPSSVEVVCEARHDDGLICHYPWSVPNALLRISWWARCVHVVNGGPVSHKPSRLLSIVSRQWQLSSRSDWRLWVDATDARKAGSACDTIRRIPRPPALTGRRAWIHWGSETVTCVIVQRSHLRRLSNCSRA